MFASANIADPRSKLWVYRPGAVGDFAQKAGYDGVELTPAFDYIASPRAIARAVKAGRLALNSVHASFRTTKRSNDTHKFEVNQKRSLVERLISTPLGRLIMPEVVNSSRFMARVRRHLKRDDLPAVMYPLKDPELDERSLKLAGPGKRLVQATDHVAALFGATTPEEFVDKLKERGYDGIIMDTAHMHPDRYAGSLPRVVSDLDRSLPVLLPHVVGVHAAFGRSDVATDTSSQLRLDTERDLVFALAGQYQGPTGQILEAARQAPGLEYVAVEVPSGSIAPMPGMEYRDSINESYTLIANGLRRYFQAPA